MCWLINYFERKILNVILRKCFMGCKMKNFSYYFICNQILKTKLY